MTTLLQKLQALLDSRHSLTIKSINEYEKSWNKTTDIGVKRLYNIHIDHTDDSFRFWPSRISEKYYHAIEAFLKEHFGDKIYLCGYSEQGTHMKINVMVRTK